MTDNIDKIRLNKDLKEEKWKRHIYTRWVKIINDRRQAGECPKCGKRMWVQRGSGFYKKWTCDNCGLTVNKKDVATGQKWWDYVTLYARDEIKRIEKAKRRSQSVRTYEKDKI
jgi:ribosomal protein L37AE/L43A